MTDQPITAQLTKPGAAGPACLTISNSKGTVRLVIGGRLVATIDFKPGTPGARKVALGHAFTVLRLTRAG